MSDQPPPDRASSDSSKQSAWDSVSETELDQALSKAASLAAELSGRLQPANERTASLGTASGSNPLADPSTGLDAELENLDLLVGTAAAQVQSVADAPFAAQGKSVELPTTTPTNSVPDFMSEFTTAAEPAAGFSDDLTAARVSGPQNQAPAAPAKLGIVGSGRMGVVGGAVTIAPLVAPPPVKTAPPPEVEREEPSSRGWKLGTRLVAPLVALLGGLAAILELIDRPLARIGGGVRRVVGWIAIAMIAASIVVFVRSIG